MYIDNLTLRPGDNEYPMRATIVDIGAVLEALGQKPYCEENGVLPFEIRGKTVVNNGQPLPYFADALASANQTVHIAIGQALKDSALNMSIPCGGLGGGKKSSGKRGVFATLL